MKIFANIGIISTFGFKFDFSADLSSAGRITTYYAL